MREKLWAIAPGDTEVEKNLSDTLGLSPIIARLLANRGVDDLQKARLFLDTPLAALEDPMKMAGMDKAVSRVIESLDRGEKIMVYGDYDVDGVTATALLYLFLNEIGAHAGYYIPERGKEGYGLNSAAITSLAEAGAKLIITVDNGINAVEAVDHANGLGVDVIITDHHLPGPILPGAVAALNPNREDCPYPCKGLSGVGVAFKLCMAVRSQLRQRGVEVDTLPNLKRYLDLVAIGSVADCSPLVGENRLLTRHGISELRAATRPGLTALKQVAGVNGGLTSRDIAFALAPRLNAAGRLGKADMGVDLLITGNSGEGARIAHKLDEENRKRQDIQKKMLDEAIRKAGQEIDFTQEKAIVIGADGWNPGVAGLVASKLTETFGLPTLVACFNGEQGVGSARSVAGFDVTAALSKVSGRLVKFGGHKLAAGFTVNRDGFEVFRREFLCLARNEIEPSQIKPTIKIDCEVNPGGIDREFLRQLETLEPYGEGNPQPVFISRGVRFTEVCYMGRDESHARLTLPGGLQALAFSKAEKFRGLDVPKTPLDIVYVAEVSTWRDMERIQLRLLDMDISV
ncbi:MAG: single-stranded-DNA-specific exonuclease RecJ [Nitrospinae bacterium]|nr:single-stranded-DNA-specific exonuclease RecJ [Nitrospinota bacterium]